jgi:CHASE2 domain-containing sensor protein
MLRSLTGTIVGYMVFALPAFALFRVTGHDPHAPASLAFEVAAVSCGMFFALLAGYVGTAIVGRRDLLVAWYIATVMIVMACWSLLASGYSWSPVTALIFMVPGAVIGGWVRLQRQ